MVLFWKYVTTHEEDDEVGDKFLSFLTDLHWKFARTLLLPTFSTSHLKQTMGIMNRVAKNLEENFSLFADSDKAVEMKQVFSCYTVDMIASTAFGIEVNSQKNPDHSLIKCFDKFFYVNFYDPITSVQTLFPVIPKILGTFGIKSNYSSSLHTVAKFSKDVIAERRKNKTVRHDFLQLLLDAKLENVDKIDDDMEHELETLTFENMSDWRSKRGKLQRYAKETVKIKDWIIPKDIPIDISIYSLQHDPEYWPEPHKFIPERFAPEAKDKLNPYNFLPFGIGPRMCIGTKMARLEFKLAIATIIRKYKFVKSPKTEGMAKFDKEMKQKYGKVLGFYICNQPHILISDPEMVKEICVKHFAVFTNRYDVFPQNKISDRFISFLKDNHWKFTRTVLLPTFSTSHLKQTMGIMNSVVKNLEENFSLFADSDKAVEIKQVFSHYTVDMIASTAFGIEVRRDFLQLLLDAKLENVDKIDDDMKHELETLTFDNMQNRGLTDEEIVAQVVLFLFASHFATSTALSFFSYILATQPEIQQKVYDEVMDVIGDEEPMVENLNKLTYLDMCMSELLRMYPPSLRLQRYAKETVKIKDWIIPKDIPIDISIYSLQHDPEYWPEPHKFIPERFAPEAKDKLNPYTFLPFGIGPRMCIGTKMARLEFKLAIATIIRKYKFVKSPKTEVPLKTGGQIFLYPVNGIWLKAEKR
ncbi:cytochrome P450 3A8-like [Octopus vulgaris]|uniref:Cytochrome P450 3A8-like n=1 Tax=Octopus vulgaris TaxID=6645 RepID=A0AA36BHS6_OCTVU|nr:cytochrome P450 3A8-like [Octopus vulgaris]